MVSETQTSWAASLLGDDGAGRIEAAIAEAESHTSGEIVPMIVRRSSTIGHVPLVAFCLLLLCLLIPDVPGWLSTLGGPEWLWLGLAWLAAAALAFALAQLDAVQRLLTPHADQVHQVELRAEVEFWENGIGRTTGDTGILLFVSLMERRAVVLADRAIAERVDAGLWQELVDLMIDGVRQGDLATGMTRAIARCGEILAPHFPIAPDDRNELRDHLIVKD
jgi:putative membrane protein